MNFYKNYYVFAWGIIFFVVSIIISHSLTIAEENYQITDRQSLLFQNLLLNQQKWHKKQEVVIKELLEKQQMKYTKSKNSDEIFSILNYEHKIQFKMLYYLNTKAAVYKPFIFSE